MGERLLQNALAAEAAPLNEMKVLSAGVAAWHGDPASPNAIKALAKTGIELKQHASQPLSNALLEKAFLVLGMTQSHLLALEAFPETKPDRAYLFREFLGGILIVKSRILMGKTSKPIGPASIPWQKRFLRFSNI